MKRQVTTAREHGFTQIWFLVEGQSKRFRCEHGAGWFRIGAEHDGHGIVSSRVFLSNRQCRSIRRSSGSVTCCAVNS